MLRAAGWIHRTGDGCAVGLTSHRHDDAVNHNTRRDLHEVLRSCDASDFQRATLTVEAQSEESAVRSALRKAEQLFESGGARLENQTEPPVIEIVFSEEEAEGDSEAGVLEYVRDVQYAYALLQAIGARLCPASRTRIRKHSMPGLLGRGARAMSWIFLLSAISGGESPTKIRIPGIEPGEVDYPAHSIPPMDAIAPE